MTSAQITEKLVEHYFFRAVIPLLFLFFEGMVQRNLFVFAYYFKFSRRPLILLKYIILEEKIYIPSKTICGSKSLAELQAFSACTVRSVSQVNLENKLVHFNEWS